MCVLSNKHCGVYIKHREKKITHDVFGTKIQLENQSKTINKSHATFVPREYILTKLCILAHRKLNQKKFNSGNCCASIFDVEKKSGCILKRSGAVCKNARTSFNINFAWFVKPSNYDFVNNSLLRIQYCANFSPFCAWCSTKFQIVERWMTVKLMRAKKVSISKRLSSKNCDFFLILSLSIYLFLCVRVSDQIYEE